MAKLNLLMGTLFTWGTLFFSPLAQGQFDTETYDDYGSFATEPVELDQEVRDLMGRYFQMNFHVGTGLYTGGLGKAHSAGALLGLRFILYFDRVWGVEMSGGYGRNTAVYNEASTEVSNIDFTQSTSIIPLSLGLRYGFDTKNMSRGFALMNPYFVAGPELIFRSEAIGSNVEASGLESSIRSKINPSATNNSTAWALMFGGGMEFDVYRNQLFLGLDTRYHWAYWSDGGDLYGQVGRGGHFISLVAHLTYNY